MKTKRKIKVSIVEDNPLFLEGYIQLLSFDQQLEIADYGTSAKAVFHNMKGSPPDVVLTTVQSTDWDATQLWSKLKKQYPNTRIVINSSINPGPLVKLLIREGVSSYFLKERISKDELVRIIIEAYYKGISKSHIVTEQIIREINEARQNHHHDLSDREYDILCLTCDGLGRKEISERLMIAESTVKFHLDKLRDRYYCHSVLHLVIHSLKEGIIRT